MSLGRGPSPTETFAAYSDRTAAEISARPRKVAGVSSAGLTAATTATTILAVQRRARYRASCVLMTTTGGDAGKTITLNIVHTDRIGAETKGVVNTLTLNATGRDSAVFVFEADNATVIQWSTTLAGPRTLSVWAVEIELEELP